LFCRRRECYYGADVKVIAVPPIAPTELRDQFDKAEISELIVAERTSRDMAQWDEMRKVWSPHSVIDISWFKGSGAAFVDASREVYEAGGRSLHQLGPALVQINGNKAIANLGCAIIFFGKIAGTDVTVTSYIRIFYRFVRANNPSEAAKSPITATQDATKSAVDAIRSAATATRDAMRQDRRYIDGMRGMYLTDSLSPVNPGEHVVLDGAKLAGFRPSYRAMAYLQSVSGQHPRQDLPGVDKPETVAALVAGEKAWLAN
jgi:hypothetical protein